MTKPLTRCECGDEVGESEFHIHSRCNYFYKLPDSEYEFYCIKFPNHKGKHQ